MSAESASARVLNGVDFSNYQGPLTTPELIDASQRYSLVFSIHGTQVPEITHQQVAHSREAKIASQELYAWMRADESERANSAVLDEAISIAEPYGIRRIAFDCERSDLDGSRPTWEQAQAAGAHMVNRGYPPILYTNPDTWENAWGSPAIPDGWEIWLADYTYLVPVPAAEWGSKAPSAMDFQSNPPVPEALQGVTKTIQWQGTTELAPGVAGDLNVRLVFLDASGDIPAPISTNGSPPAGAVPLPEPAPDAPMPGDPIQVIEQQPLPAADNRIWIVKNESETYGLQGFAFNGPYIEVYNGPALPVWRWGGERPGQLSKLFGNDYEWLASDPATAGAKWTTEVAD